MQKWQLCVGVRVCVCVCVEEEMQKCKSNWNKHVRFERVLWEILILRLTNKSLCFMVERSHTNMDTRQDSNFLLSSAVTTGNISDNGGVCVCVYVWGCLSMRVERHPRDCSVKCTDAVTKGSGMRRVHVKHSPIVCLNKATLWRQMHGQWTQLFRTHTAKWHRRVYVFM